MGKADTLEAGAQVRILTFRTPISGRVLRIDERKQCTFPIIVKLDGRPGHSCFRRCEVQEIGEST